MFFEMPPFAAATERHASDIDIFDCFRRRCPPRLIRWPPLPRRLSPLSLFALMRRRCHHHVLCLRPSLCRFFAINIKQHNGTTNNTHTLQFCCRVRYAEPPSRAKSAFAPRHGAPLTRCAHAMVTLYAAASIRAASYCSDTYAAMMPCLFAVYLRRRRFAAACCRHARNQQRRRFLCLCPRYFDAFFCLRSRLFSRVITCYAHAVVYWRHAYADFQFCR